MNFTEAQRESLEATVRGEYRVELRGAEDDCWWVCKGSRVVSRHESRRAARLAVTRLVKREMDWLMNGSTGKAGR